MEDTPPKEKPGSAGDGAIEALPATRQLSFSRRSERRLRPGLGRDQWPGATLVGFRQGAEHLLVTVAMLSATLALTATIYMFLESPTYATLGSTLPLWLPTGFAVLAMLPLDAFVVADPTDQVLRRVLIVGPLCLVTQELPRAELRCLRLRGWDGVVSSSRRIDHKRTYQTRPIHLRALEAVPLEGDPIPLIHAEALDFQNKPAARALAEAMDLELEQLEDEPMGHLERVPGVPAWVLHGSTVLTVVLWAVTLWMILGT